MDVSSQPPKRMRWITGKNSSYSVAGVLFGAACPVTRADIPGIRVFAE